MPFEFGDVVLIQFPFTNQITYKQRPAVVVSNRTYNAERPDIIVMAVTSQLRSVRADFEFWLGAWKAAGLLRASAVKPIFSTIEQTLVIRHLGRLAAADLAGVRDTISYVLG